MNAFSAAAALFAGLFLAACGGAEPETTAERDGLPSPEGSLSPTARPEVAAELRRDVDTPRHPSDGGGKAWLEPTEGGEVPAHRAGTSARFTILYEAGPLGVATGGAVYLMPDPFWGWSAPQSVDSRASGYTRVTTDVEGVVLATRPAQSMLLVEIAAGELAEGDRLRIEYGAGEAGARVDRHAERGARLWVAVDGDGDGVRAVLVDSPTVDVLAGPPARLVLTLGGAARPRETARATVAVLDAGGNAGVDVAGTVRILGRPDGWSLPEEIELAPEDTGQTSVVFEAAEAGVLRLEAEIELEDGTLLRARSNPLWIGAEAPRVFWGDLHGHSNLSDGTGTPEDYFRYARDVAALDFAALTDHDHYGVLFLDAHPEMWELIQRTVREFNEPKRFVTLPGYEWTSWLHGHRHVIWFDDSGEVRSSIDEATDDPAELWDSLRGESALTYAHHSAGGPVATNWAYPPDPELEPVTEVSSVHGSSEAPDSPSLIYAPVADNFVRDVLDRGYRLGFIGSGDSHDGHPGLPHLDPVYGWRPPAGGRGERMGTGGLAAVLAPELTREALLAAMRARSVYATSGPRIVMRIDLEGHPMGAHLVAADLGAAPELRFEVAGTATVERLDLVRSGEVVSSVEPEASAEVSGSFPLDGLKPGEYVYLRVVQEDGGLAWSSPYFVD